jgi:CheY-like chemotaxis protein
MLALYERYLSHQPFALLSFTSAEEALEAMRQRPQDIVLVVVDEELPDMAGWDMWQALREDPALHGVPIAICTLHEMDASAVPDQATHLLPKPIIADDLLRLVISG